ncbi:MAG TPA: TetR/AcrR family transcriptional regulator [Azospirillaceae bacterium]|nr:TetR/AcrR family transcriptional regulator [Azospirillaceae bacterium]
MRAATEQARRRRRLVGSPEGAQSRDRIVQHAAALFAARGYDATSMRDIAAAAGLMTASIYYHFQSKEDLFIAVHGHSMDRMVEALRGAMLAEGCPWDRLEAAAAAHCETLLGAGEFPAIITPTFPASLERVRDRLVAQRDAYERLFTQLVEALDLPPGTDRAMFRLHVLGALNWTASWYRPGGRLSPGEIGRQLVRMLRPTGQTESAAV